MIIDFILHVVIASYVEKEAPPLPQPVEVVLDLPCPEPVDFIEVAFEAAFMDKPGFCIIKVIRCESFGSIHRDHRPYDLMLISPTDDAGPAQINQIHGRRNGIIEGRWPEAVQTLEGQTWAARTLYEQSEAIGVGGGYPWKNSKYCHGQS